MDKNLQPAATPIMPDADTCYRALQARDRRFDGRFFCAVTTTGVYCRPVCSAITPRRRNCLFFACAAAAESAGFRPCLRCRPEAAPGTAAWRGTATTVARGLQLIEQGALDEGSVEDLAARLGVGQRHLRRLFVEHLGAPPLAIAQSRRAHFAKQLIVDTQLPITTVAFAAGYRNVRRFNAELKRVFHRAPTELRKRSTSATGAAIVLRQAYRPPLAWRDLLAYLASRAIPGVEQVTGDTYRRTVAEQDFRGTIEVRAPHHQCALEVHVPPSGVYVLATLARRVRRLFDLLADPLVICGQLSSSPHLASLLPRLAGVRVLGSFDRFETAVRVLLGQQISVAAASQLCGRLARAFGEPFADSDNASLTHFFHGRRPCSMPTSRVSACPRHAPNRFVRWHALSSRTNRCSSQRRASNSPCNV